MLEGGKDLKVNKRLTDIIVEQLCVDSNRVGKDTSIVNDLDADSLDVLELIMAIEEEFDVEISDKEAEQYFTVGHIEAALMEKGAING